MSQLQVALFPWDPKPEPPPIQNTPLVPSNYQHGGTPPNIPIYQTPMPNGPRVKNEPGMESQFLPIPMSQAPPQGPLMAMPNVSTAKQRAAQNLHASYGQRAAASIQSIQGGVPQQQMSPQQQQALHAQQQSHLQIQHMQHMQQMQQQQRAGNGASPPSQTQQIQGHQSQSSQQAAAAYRQSIAAQQAQQLQQQRSFQNAQNAQSAQNSQSGQAGQAPQGQNPQDSIVKAQTDGAGDDTDDSIGVIKKFDSQGNEIAMGRIEIDNLIRTKIESMGKAMEGGGLMLPLKEATKTPSTKRQRKIVAGSGSMPQTDGVGSDDEDKKVKEEEDEDAINSDLDDPDDALNDDEDDDEGMGHIMLCMYDKVQRVKNKWYVSVCFFIFSAY